MFVFVFVRGAGRIARRLCASHTCRRRPRSRSSPRLCRLYIQHCLRHGALTRSAWLTFPWTALPLSLCRRVLSCASFAPPRTPQLQLYGYQLRNIARCQRIERYASGSYKDDFGTFLQVRIMLFASVSPPHCSCRLPGGVPRKLERHCLPARAPRNVEPARWRVPPFSRSYAPKGGVIADGAGLGKTATMIGLVFSEPADRASLPNCIITPSHLIKQWEEEIRKFAPDGVVVLRGVAAFDAAITNEDVVLSNHAFVLVDVQELLEQERVWYDFRRIYQVGTRALPSGWSQTVSQTGQLVYQDVHGNTQLQKPACDERLSLKHSKELTKKLSPSDYQEIKSSALHIHGAYKGWVYRSCVHAQAFRRVIFVSAPCSSALACLATPLPVNHLRAS